MLDLRLPSTGASQLSSGAYWVFAVSGSVTWDVFLCPVYDEHCCLAVILGQATLKGTGAG